MRWGEAGRIDMGAGKLGIFIRVVHCWIIVREYLAKKKKKNLNLNHVSLHDLIDLPQENSLPT